MTLTTSAIAPPSEHARSAARERQAGLAKPPGALGRLEELSIWLAGVQDACPPRPLVHPRVLVLAGDHGVTGAGVSAYPPAITPAMVRLIVAGGAAVNALARSAGATVRVVDLAVDDDLADLPAEVGRYKVRRSTGRMPEEDALTAEETQRAYDAGRALADEEIDSGADILLLGDLGIGNTTPAAALIGALTGSEAAAVVGRGTGIDDPTWMRKCAVVRDALRKVATDPTALKDPLRLLAIAGGADFAAGAGLLVQAAARRTPVILDGVISGACALVAARIDPGVTAWQLAGHRSAEPGHARALSHLGLVPVVDYGMRLGEGTGAALALPMLQAAGAALREMALIADLAP